MNYFWLLAIPVVLFLYHFNPKPKPIVTRRYSGKVPIPLKVQLSTTQSLASSGNNWARCYDCPSLGRCGEMEMCEEEFLKKE